MGITASQEEEVEILITEIVIAIFASNLTEADVRTVLAVNLNTSVQFVGNGGTEHLIVGKHLVRKDNSGWKETGNLAKLNGRIASRMTKVTGVGKTISTKEMEEIVTNKRLFWRCNTSIFNLFNVKISNVVKCFHVL